MIALETQKLLCLWVYAAVMHVGQKGGQFLFIYSATWKMVSYILRKAMQDESYVLQELQFSPFFCKHNCSAVYYE